MKRACLPVMVAILMVLSIPAYAEQDPKEILKAVVKIRSVIPDYARSAKTLGTEREGSGVLIDSKGHILTIGYLILEAETIEVSGPEGKPISAASVAYDHNTGFGLLRADKPLEAKPIELGQSSEVEEGDPVLVASYGGVEAAQGVRVIALKEFAGYWEYLLDKAIFTAPAYANFGGAALFNRSGRLVGIGSLFSTVPVPGVGSVPGNMFVPIDLLKPILPDLIAKGRSAGPSKPWLGINVEETHGRIIVTRITTESPAEKGGLRPGDIILTVNKKEVSGLADFYRKLWALGNPGVDVPLSILQGIRIRDLTIKSADRYQYYPLKPQKKI